MTLATQLDIFAVILLVSTTFVFIIDVMVERYGKLINMKWTAAWYAARYTGIICGILMAVNILLE